MHNYDVELFLGFPITENYQEALNAIDPRLFDLYVKQEDPSYLQVLDHEGIRYLGKFIDSLTEISTLELLQLNIYSLLNKLVSDFPYEKIPLRLIPYIHHLKKSNN